MAIANLSVGSASQGRAWDQVATGPPDRRSWTRDQFEKLPLIDRVRLLSSGELHFYVAGQEIPAREAIRTR